MSINSAYNLININNINNINNIYNLIKKYINICSLVEPAPGIVYYSGG